MSKREACEGARGVFPRDRGTKGVHCHEYLHGLKKRGRSILFGPKHHHVYNV